MCTFVISFPAVILLRLLRVSLQAGDRLPEARGGDKPLVHIVDREADSVAHWRAWSAQGSRFLVRAKDAPKVCFEGVPVKPKELAERLSYQSAGEVLYHGRIAHQTIAQAKVLITRKAKPKRAVGGKRVAPVAGKPLALRLVVSRIRDAQGQRLAQWLLLTNVPDEVDAATLARWYYYRWQIESMFKLLKSAGQQVEDWLQDDALAIAKRLVVASCACVLVGPGRDVFLPRPACGERAGARGEQHRSRTEMPARVS